jgi:hypothetical protein
MTSLRRSSLFRDFTQRMLAPCYGSFGTTYRSHLRMSWPSKVGPTDCPETSECWALEDGTDTLSRNVGILDPRRWDRYVVPKRRNVWPSKVGPIRCPETSATNYQYTLCKSAEEWKSRLHCDGSLKPRITLLMTLGGSNSLAGEPVTLHWRYLCYFNTVFPLALCRNVC